MEKGDDPYRILGLPSSHTASESEIKTAYRQLALREHPDRKSDPTERELAVHKFAKISNAYEILSDPVKRREYDDLQKEQKQATGAARGYDRRQVNVDFHSPYEVFKRDFEDMMGFAYPGSKYDFNEAMIENGPQGNKKKGSSSSNKNNKNSSSSGQRPPSSSSSTTARESSRSSNSTRNSTDLVVRSDKSSSSPSSSKKSDSRALVVADQNKSGSNRNSSSSTDCRALVPSQGQGALIKAGDNRPISMSTTQKKVKHPDGTVETITETKMERPDGSVETVRTTDRGDKRPDWSQPQAKSNKNGKTNTPKRLTNGEESPRLLLTNGKVGRDHGASRAPLALTNGPSTNRQNQSNTDHQRQMVVHEDNSKPHRKNMLAFWK